MVGKLEHAWKELRTGGRGLGGGTGLAGSSSSSRFPLLRNEGRKTMESVESILFGCMHRPAGGQEPRLQMHPDVPFLRIREARMLGEGDIGKEQPSLGRASWFSNSQRAKEPS